MAKQPSRIQRWVKAVATARVALEEVEEIRQEYEDWQGNLPENLQDSPLGQKLQEAAEADVDSLLSGLEDLDGLDLPQGFGRD